MIYRVETKWSGAQLVEANRMDDAVAMVRESAAAAFAEFYNQEPEIGEDGRRVPIGDVIPDEQIEPHRAELVAEEVLHAKPARE